MNGIFDSPYLGRDALGQEVETESPSLLIRTSDIEDKIIERGTQLKIDSVIYYVKDIHTGNDDLTTLLLSLDEQV